MLNKPSIHERSAVIEERQRTGNFEGDTIIGHDHKGIVVSSNNFKIEMRQPRLAVLFILSSTRHLFHFWICLTIRNVCRKSLFVQMKALPNRKTEAVINALINFTKQTKIHSIMLDNGTEFEEYQRLIDKNVEVFFADPCLF